jgi:2-methylcitrate synthase/citrate synthase II
MEQEKKPSYSPGLEDVIAGETSISSVSPEPALVYRGYEIEDLARNASYEEIVWLLLKGELPTMTQLAGLSRDLADERVLPPAVLDMLRLMPPNAHPMDTLRTGVSMLAAFDPDLEDNSPAANLRKSVRLIAKTARLATDAWRLAHDQDLLPPDRNLTHAGNFLLQLTGEIPDLLCAEALDTVLVAYADHGFNASTFSARVTASTLAHPYAAVTSALGSLQGPLHGGANEQAMKTLREIGSADQVEVWVKARLGRKEKIMGFGHRVYHKGDARVPVLRELACDLGRRFGQQQWAGICASLERVMEREKGLYANLDLYAAPVLFLLGIPPELNTAVFACARVAGWCAHILEQQAHNRLIRPRSLYTGPAHRKYPARGRQDAA